MIPLGSLLGVPLRMHFAFPVLLAAMALGGCARGMPGALAALFWHEAGHVLAARLCGARLTRVELTPFGFAADYDGEALSPMREALTALSGPLASAAGALVFRALPRFSMAHAALFALNLLPVLPLDGGRALRAALSARFRRARVTRALALAGEAMGAALAACGVASAAKGRVNPTLFLCGAYLFYLALRETETPALLCARALYGRAERLKKRGALPVRWLAAPEDTSPALLARRLTDGAFFMIVLLDGEARAVETLSETELLRRCLSERPQEKGAPCAPKRIKP